MRSPVSALLLLLGWVGTASATVGPTSFQILGTAPGGWPRLLSAVGLVPAAERGSVVVVRPGAAPQKAPSMDQIRDGLFVVVEGASPAAEAYGFRAGKSRTRVRNVQDARVPQLPIIWEKPEDVAVSTLPRQAQVFAKERWQGAPMMAGFRHGSGGLLWVATGIGDQGYERYPYLLQALADVGFTPPVRGQRLWAFFDSSYRLRVDLDYFATRWRKAGIGALQVAGWHYFDADPGQQQYLRDLITACHKQGILVYAWLELPHVSERFWQQHPEWREQTATLQDAHLDWRKLMNLQNPACREAVARGVHALLQNFDWDGVNLAELYFESLEGADNPARFTPMNADVRREFATRRGFDPHLLFDPQSPHFAAKSPADLTAFLEFRAELARRLQREWLTEMRAARLHKPYLHAVLTHVDDRLDTRMRQLIGADAAQTLPLLEEGEFTFLIEDPATLWHLGPERYPQIAARYAPLTPKREQLAIDLNIVDRYQEVYPTKQQTGGELLQLVHLAGSSFPQVALYFEQSLRPVDLSLLPAALAQPQRLERAKEGVRVSSSRGLGLHWPGAALVDGQPWPVAGDGVVWLPAGEHTVHPAPESGGMSVMQVNGDLLEASRSGRGAAFRYRAVARALVRVSSVPARVVLDGQEVTVPMLASEDTTVLVLPPGEHRVFVEPQLP